MEYLNQELQEKIKEQKDYIVSLKSHYFCLQEKYNKILKTTTNNKSNEYKQKYTNCQKKLMELTKINRELDLKCTNIDKKLNQLENSLKIAHEFIVNMLSYKNK